MKRNRVIRVDDADWERWRQVAKVLDVSIGQLIRSQMLKFRLTDQPPESPINPAPLS